MNLSTVKVWGKHRKARARLACAIGLILVIGASACSSAAGAAGKSNTLRLGVTASEVTKIDPYANVVSQDGYLRHANLYDTLVKHTRGGLKWSLAVGLTHNEQNTVWTVKLRPGVKFHDGSTFGADDVVATVDRILDPKNNITFASKIHFVKSVTKVDNLTVRFDLSEPIGVFKQVLAYDKFVMVKKGSTPQKPVGTGPFTLESFNPGRSTVLKAFDGYWGGRPKIDTLKILSFQTPQAVTNALLGGQIDVTSVLTRNTIKSVESRPNLKLLKSDPIRMIRIGMRADVPPFNDVRVRQAMRLLLDRKLTLSNAFEGRGVLANDWEAGLQEQCSPKVPQRKQNIAKAKQLLQEAGQLHRTFTLRTGANQPGMLREVQILAQNAKKAGVNIKIQKMALDSYLDKWGDWTFFTGYTTPTYRRQAQSQSSDKPSINPTRWNDTEYRQLYAKLIATSDAAKRCDIKKQMKKIEYDRGPSIFAVANPVLTAYSDNVHGLEPTVLHGVPYDFRTVSIS